MMAHSQQHPLLWLDARLEDIKQRESAEKQKRDLSDYSGNPPSVREAFFALTDQYERERIEAEREWHHQFAEWLAHERAARHPDLVIWAHLVKEKWLYNHESRSAYYYTGHPAYWLRTSASRFVQAFERYAEELHDAADRHDDPAQRHKDSLLSELRKPWRTPRASVERIRGGKLCNRTPNAIATILSVWNADGDRMEDARTLLCDIGVVAINDWQVTRGILLAPYDALTPTEQWADTIGLQHYGPTDAASHLAHASTFVRWRFVIAYLRDADATLRGIATSTLEDLRHHEALATEQWELVAEWIRTACTGVRMEHTSSMTRCGVSDACLGAVATSIALPEHALAALLNAITDVGIFALVTRHLVHHSTTDHWNRVFKRLEQLGGMDAVVACISMLSPPKDTTFLCMNRNLWALDLCKEVNDTTERLTDTQWGTIAERTRDRRIREIAALHRLLFRNRRKSFSLEWSLR